MRPLLSPTSLRDARALRDRARFLRARARAACSRSSALQWRVNARIARSEAIILHVPRLYVVRDESA